MMSLSTGAMASGTDTDKIIKDGMNEYRPCSQNNGYKNGGQSFKKVVFKTWIAKTKYCGVKILHEEWIPKNDPDDQRVRKQEITSHHIHSYKYGIKWHEAYGRLNAFLNVKFDSYSIRITKTLNTCELYPNLCIDGKRKPSYLDGITSNVRISSFTDGEHQIWWSFWKKTDKSPARICEDGPNYYNKTAVKYVLDKEDLYGKNCVFFPDSINDDPVSAMMMLLELRPVEILHYYES